MSYKQLFSVTDNIHRIQAKDTTDPSSQNPVADRRGELYLFSDELILAIHVGLDTGRPLLLTGLPGSGKSTLARHVAHLLNWRYLEEVITHQTRGQELLYHLDLLERLYDTNRAGPGTDQSISDWTRYVRPGVLWQAIDFSSAQKLDPSLDPTQSKKAQANLHAPDRPVILRTGESSSSLESAPAVVLLDEIDKADPEVPNSLLQVLGRMEFFIPPLKQWVRAASDCHPLVVLTSNGERSLPDAFVRRCITYKLETPSDASLLRLLDEFFKDWKLEPDQKALLPVLVKRFQEIVKDQAQRRRASTAELLDLAEVCIRWKLNQDSPELEQLLNVTVRKPLDEEQ